MASRAVISFVRSDYSVYGSSPSTSQNTSPRQRGLVLSALQVMTERAYWDTMSDADWDVLSDEIADLIEVFQS